MQMDDPAVAVVATVRESCRAWSVIPEAIRKTLALASLDAEIGELVRNYERHRRARLAVLARRVCRAGAAPTRPRVREAAAMLAVFTSFTTFDQLRFDNDPRRSTDLLVRMTKASFGFGADLEPP